MRKKKTKLLSLLNKDWKKVKVDTEKVNKILQLIPIDNITELTELISARAKLISDKMSISSKHPNTIKNQKDLSGKTSYKDKLKNCDKRNNKGKWNIQESNRNQRP